MTGGLRGCSNRIVITALFWKLEVKCLEQREPFSDLHKGSGWASGLYFPLVLAGSKLGVQVTAILLRGKTLETKDKRQLQSCD